MNSKKQLSLFIWLSIASTIFSASLAMEEGPPTKYNLVCKSKKHRTSNIVHDASTAKWNKKKKRA